MIRTILGHRAFEFPKSLYAVKDALSTIVGDSPNALIVDFFAGSGTTLNSVNLMNAVDGGSRRCILVTNNEVSGDDADSLRGRSVFPGDDAWEALGICRSVTWPRSKFTILGSRDDKSQLPGEYLTGQVHEIEKPRKFTHIGFLDREALDTVTKKKQFVSLIEELPQSVVEGKSSFIVSEDFPVSVLFDDSQFEAWLEALDGHDHITRVVIVTPTKRRFDELKARVDDVLGPLMVNEEARRPLREGFSANVEYFRLDFLDKDQVALKRRFREILPLLWMRAGCVGPRPSLPVKKVNQRF